MRAVRLNQNSKVAGCNTNTKLKLEFCKKSFAITSDTFHITQQSSFHPDFVQVFTTFPQKKKKANECTFPSTTFV